MRSPCSWIARIFLGLWIVALVILGIGTFGVLDQEQDPLSGIFLIPLGLPWNRFVDLAPEATWPWLAALAPGINLIILRLFCAAFVDKGTTR